MGQVFRHAEQYLSQFDPDYVGQFVEIGTSRNGDDGSTRTIAGWADRFDKSLWTVDMDANNCNFVIEQNITNVEVINETGESYLEKFPRHIAYISFLYLDNFDWDWHPEQSEDFVIEQQKRYRALGIEMNNVNSQRAHLRQAELALPALGDRSIVVCDDTWFNPNWGHYTGKSGSAVPFLLNHGFEVLYTEAHPEYGTILGRGITGN
jgi:hypothetical protein